MSANSRGEQDALRRQDTGGQQQGYLEKVSHSRRVGDL
jgi:hypothetical protein